MIKRLFRMLVGGAILCSVTACQADLSIPTQITPTTTPQVIPVETIIPTPINNRIRSLDGTPALENTTTPPEPVPSRQATSQDLLHSDTAQNAQADLARRLGVNINEIQVVSIDTQELPIQDLGCQVLTPTPARGEVLQGGSPQPVVPGIVMGQVIRLKAGGKFFEYHAFGIRIIYCGSLSGGN